MKRSVLIGVIYSVLVIIYKLIIWKGGYTFSRFGFNFSHIVSVFAIIPFLFVAIYQERKSRNGFIRGREAIKEALMVMAVSAILLSVYNYIEFSMSIDLYKSYYQSEQYLALLEKDPKAKEFGFQKIIDYQISNLSPFKSTTAKLFPFVLLTVSFSFIISVFMKRYPKANQ